MKNYHSRQVIWTLCLFLSAMGCAEESMVSDGLADLQEEAEASGSMGQSPFASGGMSEAATFPEANGNTTGNDECVCEELACGVNDCGLDCGPCEEGLTCDKGVCTSPGESEAGSESAEEASTEEGTESDSEGVTGEEETGGEETNEEESSEEEGPEECIPDCENKECGPNGCGDVCGKCEGADTCTEKGVCKSSCIPECDGKECGDDGCGETCGECEAGFNCDDGACIEECAPECGDSVCGDDGCGGTCGECAEGELCNDGACVAECTPNCAGKECGGDGCGNLCGGCAPGENCSLLGQCIPIGCEPDCTGKECGDDGCGATCGTCEEELTCEDGICLIPNDQSCCEPGINPGCNSEACQGCVCATNSFCCEFAWDESCVESATLSCGNICACEEPAALCGDGACTPDETCSSCPQDCGPCLPQADSTCCVLKVDQFTDTDLLPPSAYQGCVENLPCESCVCGLDAWCCTNGWDLYCEQAANAPCVAQCGCGEASGDFECGNGICEEPMEACGWCPQDCGECKWCGNDVCDDNESCDLCPSDCGSCLGEYCGDNICNALETCENCAVDCCADGICGDGTCGAGEDCLTCSQDCGPCTAPCGDGICDVGESCNTCAVDCCLDGDQSCCEPTATGAPGCGDSVCQDCVCSLEPFCCDVAYSPICSMLATDPLYCGGFPCVCDGTGTGTGPCAGNCDSPFYGPDGGFEPLCWCDSSCISFGDCCPDACSECGHCYGDDDLFIP